MPYCLLHDNPTNNLHPAASLYIETTNQNHQAIGDN